MAPKKQRLDVALLERGLVSSRARGRALIMAGQVRVGDEVVTKAGFAVAPEAEITLAQPDHPWASRGGLKLAAALDAFSVETAGKVAIDVGASTGGFTDVLLSRGVRKVFAVDVGYGQLDWRLRQDERVTVLERENIRHLDAARLGEEIDLAVIDVSFISLTKVLGKVIELLEPAAGKSIVALIKPQFEVGKGQVGRGGVVRDPELRASAVREVCRWAAERGLEAEAEPIESPITGPAGNREYLVHWRLGAAGESGTRRPRG